MYFIKRTFIFSFVLFYKKEKWSIVAQNSNNFPPWRNGVWPTKNSVCIYINKKIHFFISHNTSTQHKGLSLSSLLFHSLFHISLFCVFGFPWIHFTTIALFLFEGFIFYSSLFLYLFVSDSMLFMYAWVWFLVCYVLLFFICTCMHHNMYC